MAYVDPRSDQDRRCHRRVPDLYLGFERRVPGRHQHRVDDVHHAIRCAHVRRHHLRVVDGKAGGGFDVRLDLLALDRPDLLAVLQIRRVDRALHHVVLQDIGSFALFSGLRSESSVPFGNLAKASFVGANTVNGPVPESVSTRPPAFTAVTSVDKSAVAAASSTMFCSMEGGISTVSMMCTTPFDAPTSAVTTFASLMVMSVADLTCASTCLPSTVV